MPPRVFLDWSRPLLPALTEWLLPRPSGPEAPDLSSTVVVVPTSGAVRRLRESLACKAGETGMLSPHVITPEVLISWGVEQAETVAGRGEQVMAWAAVLTELRLDDWRALFPLDPVNHDRAWAVQAAGDLLKLRRTLEEGGRTLSMAGRDLGSAHPEAERWQALGRLESLAVARLAAGGWRDPATVRLAAARTPVLPEGVTRMVVAAVPDSIRLVRIALESLTRRADLEVVVIVHSAPDLAEFFDPWGRPVPEVWMKRVIKLPKGTRSISLLSRPEDEAVVLMEELSSGKNHADTLVIGSADPEVAAPLRRRAGAEGIKVFDPDGVPLLEHEVSWLLRTLTRLLHSGAWSAAGQLLRIPDVLRSTGHAANAPDGVKVLQEWDAFQAARLPQTLSQAAPLAKHWADETRAGKSRSEEPPGARGVGSSIALPRVIAWFQRWIIEFQRVPLSMITESFLESIYGDRHFATGAMRRQFTDAVTAWQDAVISVERGAAAFLPDLPAAARLDLAASLVRDARLYLPHADEAHALHGWLELPWQDAPDLMIAGMNEGMVPDSMQGDAWLPDSVRGLLDLKTNDTRLARDSYLLSAMIESRRKEGSVQLLAARQTAAGDPLKPSRLLLRCLAEDLPERALHLFPRDLAEDRERAATSPSWKRAWSLAIPAPAEHAPVFTRLSVTAFTDYLKCPFRFYLKHVLKMEPYDASQAELDARAFGSLFHDTMQELHQNETLRDGTDAAALTSFLHHVLEQRMERTFGDRLTIPVAVQMDTLRHCLTKAAELHAAERADGWRFEEVEIDFPSLPGSDQPVRISGVEIRGRIDLIERHPAKGLRILDYKTSSKAVTPRAAHLKRTKSTEGESAWKFSDLEGTAHAWQNLQLPLYARIMGRHYDEPVAVGYVNLPRATSEARVEMWEDLDEALLNDAEMCAKGVISSIKAGRFWPPAERIKFDDFEPLIFGDVRAGFDPRHLERIGPLIAAGQFRPGNPNL